MTFEQENQADIEETIVSEIDASFRNAVGYAKTLILGNVSQNRLLRHSHKRMMKGWNEAEVFFQEFSNARDYMTKLKDQDGAEDWNDTTFFDAGRVDGLRLLVEAIREEARVSENNPRISAGLIEIAKIIETQETFSWNNKYGTGFVNSFLEIFETAEYASISNDEASEVNADSYDAGMIYSIDYALDCGIYESDCPAGFERTLKA